MSSAEYQLHAGGMLLATGFDHGWLIEGDQCIELTTGRRS
jgi:hypothetical protein